MPFRGKIKRGGPHPSGYPHLPSSTATRCVCLGGALARPCTISVLGSRRAAAKDRKQQGFKEQSRFQAFLIFQDIGEKLYCGSKTAPAHRDGLRITTHIPASPPTIGGVASWRRLSPDSVMRGSPDVAGVVPLPDSSVAHAHTILS